MTRADDQDDVDEYAERLNAEADEIGCIELAETLSERRECEPDERSD